MPTATSPFRATFIALLLLYGTASAGDEAPKAADLQSIMTQAQEAVDAGRLDEAVRLLRKAVQVITPDRAGALRGELHFFSALLEAERGREAQAEAALADAAEAGFVDWDLVQSAHQFAELKNRPRVRLVIERMKDAERRRRPILVTEWENPDVTSADLHLFDALDAPESKELRVTWRLANVIAGQQTELDQQLALAAWVHNRFRHHGSNEPSKPDARTILTEAAEGHRFRCVEYSIVLAEVLQAMGFPARVLSLRRAGPSHGTGKGHVVTEVWNNELGKWLVIDGQNNGTWRLADRVLDADEIRALLPDKAKELRFQLGASSWRAGQKGVLDDPKQRADWVRYFRHLVYRYDNTRLSRVAGPRSVVALLAPGEQYEPVFQGVPSQVKEQTQDRARLYPELNRVHFDIRAAAQDGRISNVLTLAFSHSSPWFAFYRITVNGKPSEQTEHSFRWKLAPGENRLEVRAIDQMGRAGPRSWVTVNYQPQAQAR